MATAVVTGASSGIGYEFARLLAAEKYDLVLVARNLDRLNDIHKELQDRHGIRVLVVPADLAREDAARGVHNEIQSRGMSVDMLINNAGFGYCGPYMEQSWENERDILQVNLISLVRLTRLVLPDMIARGQGYICNVASTAAFFPGPYMAVYYAGKAYLFPGPQAVGAAVVENAATLGVATLITLKEASLGYLAAIVIGVLLAAVMSQSRLIERSLYPYAVLLQTVPVVAVAPLIVLWFGYNELSVVVISFVMALFPIVNNTLLGLRSTSRTLVELFALHNKSRVTGFWKLRLPSALPSIFAGLRISAGLSVIGAIVGEFIIGSGNTQGGLGVQIVFAQGRMYTALLFAEVIAATLLGFLFFQKTRKGFADVL